MSTQVLPPSNLGLQDLLLLIAHVQTKHVSDGEYILTHAKICVHSYIRALPSTVGNPMHDSVIELRDNFNDAVNAVSGNGARKELITAAHQVTMTAHCTMKVIDLAAFRDNRVWLVHHIRLFPNLTQPERDKLIDYMDLIFLYWIVVDQLDQYPDLQEKSREAINHSIGEVTSVLPGIAPLMSICTRLKFSDGFSSNIVGRVVFVTRQDPDHEGQELINIWSVFGDFL
jgi:hypothetical protein